MSDSSPCELCAAWLCGCVPWAWPGSDPGEVSEISHQRTNPQTPHCLIPTSLGTGTHAWQSTHSETPTPSSLQDTSWMLSGAPSVVRSRAALHMYMHRRVYGGGGSPGMSTILCASWEARSLCDRAYTLFEKFICIADTNCISSDVLPLCSAQPENLLSGALMVQGKVPCSWLSSHRTAGRIR